MSTRRLRVQLDYDGYGGIFFKADGITSELVVKDIREGSSGSCGLPLHLVWQSVCNKFHSSEYPFRIRFLQLIGPV